MNTHDNPTPEDDIYLEFSRQIERMRNEIQMRFHCRREEFAKFAPRILLVGPPGVGKSTLVNTVFGLEEGEAKIRAGGKPCTQHFTEYGPFDHIPVIIIDSVGFEGAPRFTDDILKYVKGRNRELTVQNHVHMVWYMPSDRWQSRDATFIRTLRNKATANVIVVLTKCDLRLQTNPGVDLPAIDNMKCAIAEDLPDVPIVACATPPEGSTYWLPKTCPRDHHQKYFALHILSGSWVCGGDRNGMCNERGTERTGPFGHIELVERTIKKIPKMVRESFLVAQVVDIKRKRRAAASIISFNTVSAMTVGALELPFSDLPVLLFIESTMSASLFHIFDVDPSTVAPETWLKLNGVVLGVAGTVGSGFAKALKATGALAPFGTAIDATIAGTVVATLGSSLTIVCEGLPPRSGFEEIDKKLFAQQLYEAVNVVRMRGLDAVLKAAATAVGLGDNSGNGLIENITNLIVSAREEEEIHPSEKSEK